MEKIKLKKYLAYILLFGFLMIMNANGLGELLSREYGMGGNGWSIDERVANNNAMSVMLIGTLSSLISGLGLVFMFVKDTEE